MWSGEDLSPRFRNQQWQKVFEDQLESTPATIQAADPLFSLPLGKESVEWSTWLTKEGVWDRFHTISHVAVLEGEELEVSVLVRLLECYCGVLTVYLRLRRRRPSRH
jgi:hypothetical protein